MCVGVFGPSQAGNPILFPRSRGEKPSGSGRVRWHCVRARFRARSIPKAAVIHKARDTVFDAPTPTPPGYPVAVRLLSQPDLRYAIPICWIANSMTKNSGGGRPQRWSQERTLTATAPVLDEEDIWDIRSISSNASRGSRSSASSQPSVIGIRCKSWRRNYHGGPLPAVQHVWGQIGNLPMSASGFAKSSTAGQRGGCILHH